MKEVLAGCDEVLAGWLPHRTGKMQEHVSSEGFGWLQPLLSQIKIIPIHICSNLLCCRATKAMTFIEAINSPCR
jgi:hypothetical protein